MTAAEYRPEDCRETLYEVTEYNEHYRETIYRVTEYRLKTTYKAKSHVDGQNSLFVLLCGSKVQSLNKNPPGIPSIS